MTKRIWHSVVLCGVGLGVTACVAGAPHLTSAQQVRAAAMPVYLVGDTPTGTLTPIGAVDAIDCSGPAGSRLYGDTDKAKGILVQKAAALEADALVEVRCGNVLPFWHNCWLARECSGQAVRLP